MSMKLNELNIMQASKGLQNGEFSSVELTRACLDRIKNTDDKIKAFITVTKNYALLQAEKADQRIKAGDEKDNFLLGVPCSIKDIVLTKNILTTAASKILNNYIPPYDATLITKLKKAGMVMLGKVNCDAFAHGSSTENSDFFTTHNPWDLKRVPGGSSGGSSASVVADQCLYSIGTDTGGSIRQPAAFCGMVGLKPTYGRVSRYGLVAMTSSTDCPSIMAKNVKDSAVILEKIAGKDKRDATTLNKSVDNYANLLDNYNIKGAKIGVPKEYFTKELNNAVGDSVKRAIKKLEELGAEIIEISLPHTKYAVPAYYIITPSEISSNLSRFDGIRFGYSETGKENSEAKNLLDIYLKSKGEGFGSEAKRRIMLGTYALSSGYYDAYYLQAQKVRTLIKKDFEDAFQKVDLIIAPTSPTVAFKIGEHSDNILEMYLEDIFLSAVSLAGLPALSIPCGFAKPENGDKEMPIGMQIIGKPFDEKSILGIANAYEENANWSKKKLSV
ncbi:MAG: Asp-tRNA(Asn)/Glu-tRNA(Gln) amidotransferase subunit GatA [Patescibacteria group bacterium]|nr:Asp-tRNA(Asn)/Glu-tRNA(Gln) amidotransferase subunit GatA [Patescibacteria group bacterium]